MATGDLRYRLNQISKKYMLRDITNAPSYNGNTNSEPHLLIEDQKESAYHDIRSYIGIDCNTNNSSRFLKLVDFWIHMELYIDPQYDFCMSRNIEEQYRFDKTTELREIMTEYLQTI